MGRRLLRTFCSSSIQLRCNSGDVRFSRCQLTALHPLCGSGSTRLGLVCPPVAEVEAQGDSGARVVRSLFVSESERVMRRGMGHYVDEIVAGLRNRGGPVLAII